MTGCGRIAPVFDAVTFGGVDEIFSLHFGWQREAVDDDKLYLHLFGQDVFYVYRNAVTHAYSLGKFGKSRKIGRKLDENSVAFDTAADSGAKDAAKIPEAIAAVPSIVEGMLK